MSTNYRIYGLSCVFVGKANPAIFHPTWLLHKGLIREAEAANAQIQVVHNSVASFQVSNITVSANEERIALETADESKFEVMRDLAQGILSLLESTPITSAGINTMIHYAMPNTDAWHDFGHRLVPKAFWNDILESPGTLRVMVRGNNPHALSGGIHVTIEPSTRFVNGVFILINNHNEFRNSQDSRGALDLLTNHFDAIVRESREKADKIIESSHDRGH